MCNKHAKKHVSNILVSDSAMYSQSQTAPRVLIDDRQPLSGRTRTDVIEDKVPRPGRILPFDAGADCNPDQ